MNSDLLLHILDTQLMRESMISFMSVLMKSMQKDNFYVKTRMAVQDTVALFYVVRCLASNFQIDFYLPCLVEMLSDLLDCERCSLYLFDRAADELYCKVMTGRTKR